MIDWIKALGMLELGLVISVLAACAGYFCTGFLASLIDYFRKK